MYFLNGIYHNTLSVCQIWIWPTLSWKWWHETLNWIKTKYLFKCIRLWPLIKEIHGYRQTPFSATAHFANHSHTGHGKKSAILGWEVIRGKQKVNLEVGSHKRVFTVSSFLFLTFLFFSFFLLFLSFNISLPTSYYKIHTSYVIHLLPTSYFSLATHFPVPYSRVQTGQGSGL